MSDLQNPYHIALTKLPSLGAKGIRQLVELVPDIEHIFDFSHEQLKELFSTHDSIIRAIESKAVLKQAEQDVKEMARYGIKTLFFTEEAYPQRMNNAGCEDTPVLLYQLGNCDLNPAHSVAMVGARKCTDYGLTTTQRLIQEMVSDKPLIVSGLAYGIDTAAHQTAVDSGLSTVAVLGHGLDVIYPNQNRLLAKRILDSGGALLTEYPLYTKLNAAYFPARNRIVAAMSDATVVVESAERGGGLITANMANGYHREVFAVPGRLGDILSEGCNNLIVNNKAIMVRNAGDIYFQMGWQHQFVRRRHKEEQQSLFLTLSPDQQVITKLLEQQSEMTIDQMEKNSTLSLPKIASILMELELKKVVRCLPGQLYKMV